MSHEPRRGGPITCPATHDVATGYGVLDCDLPHPHDEGHHDPTHRITWWPDEEVDDG